MTSIEDKIETLEIELLRLKELQKRPSIIIGRIYVKEGTDCFYTFIDWNGEIRLLNITNSHMWKPTVKSYRYRNHNTHKASTIPYHVAIDTWSAGIEKFSLKD